MYRACVIFFFFQAEDGIRDSSVTGVQTCALPISGRRRIPRHRHDARLPFECRRLRSPRRHQPPALPYGYPQTGNRARILHRVRRILRARTGAPRRILRGRPRRRYAGRGLRHHAWPDFHSQRCHALRRLPGKAADGIQAALLENSLSHSSVTPAPVQPSARVLVVGGGISGLCCAYYLRTSGVSAIVLDHSPPPGGYIRSAVRDACILEAGPQSFLSTDPPLEMLEDIGLPSERLIAHPPAPPTVLIN